MHRARAAGLLEIDRARTRIATDLHDDIGSSLSQMGILSEVAHQRAAGDKASEPLDRIGALSRELLDSISDIVWAIQPHKDHLSDLKQRTRAASVAGTFAQRAAPAGISGPRLRDEVVISRALRIAVLLAPATSFT